MLQINADTKSILVCINLLRIKNCGLLKLITVNQMLEDSKTLLHENYHPLWFVTKQINLFLEILLVQQWNIKKLKRYAKPLGRLTHTQVKRVVVKISAPSCKNTFKKLMFHLSICFNKQKYIWHSLYLKRLDPRVTLVSLC